MQLRAENQNLVSALSNYQQILYQFFDFTQNLKQSRNLTKFPDLSHHRAYRSVHGGSINLTRNTPFGVVI